MVVVRRQRVKGLSSTPLKCMEKLEIVEKRDVTVTVCVTQRLTDGVKNKRGISLLSVRTVSDRSTEDVKGGVRAYLMHYTDFCRQLLKNYGFFLNQCDQCPG